MSSLIIFDENGDVFSRVSGAFVEIENQEIPEGFSITKIDESLALPSISIDKAEVSADAQDMVTFSGVPVDSSVFVNDKYQGQTTEADQGEITYQTDSAGLHKFLIRHELYLDFEVTINAN
jgi:hypothetical protein